MPQSVGAKLAEDVFLVSLAFFVEVLEDEFYFLAQQVRAYLGLEEAAPDKEGQPPQPLAHAVTWHRKVPSGALSPTKQDVTRAPFEGEGAPVGGLHQRGEAVARALLRLVLLGEGVAADLNFPGGCGGIQLEADPIR